MYIYKIISIIQLKEGYLILQNLLYYVKDGAAIRKTTPSDTHFQNRAKEAGILNLFQCVKKKGLIQEALDVLFHKMRSALWSYLQSSWPVTHL